MRVTLPGHPASGKAGADGVVPISARDRRADRKAAVHSRILKSAREIFFRDGFNEASLDEIASRAETGKGTLYRHFESKAELYVAVLAENGTAFEERMRESVSGDGPAIERIRQIGLFYRRYWLDHPEHFGIFWAVHSQAFIGELSRPMLEEVTRIWESPLRLVEQILTEGMERGEVRACDPWVMANVIWRTGNSAVEALVTPKRARVVDCSPEPIFRTTLDLILAGLRPEPAQ
ncbi:MAG: TetR/AcrR family transcriptional regulator [Myxococcota bacterium]